MIVSSPTVRTGRSSQRPEGPPPGPKGAWRQVANYLEAAAATEEQLLDALDVVGRRHRRNYEIWHGATTLATWSREHVRALGRERDRYGRVPKGKARALPAVLGRARAGVVGELRDLCDLACLAHRAELTWTILVQGARELHDDELLGVALAARDQTRRQIAWFQTIIEHEAPDALAVVPDSSR
jgi:hypothetical protein